MKIILSGILFTLITSISFAQDYKKISNPASCKKAIQDQHKSAKSISADFHEKVYSEMFETPQKGSGKMFFKQSQKIRWEHTAPKKQVILINGKNVRMSENGKEVKNTASKTILKKVQNIMLQMLSGEFLEEKDFTITYFENTVNYKLVLTPKNDRMARYIAQVELIFEKKSLVLKEMSLIEKENEKIVYTFTNVQVNGAIDESKFTIF
jgi:outer membrane lipoprotein carrier protein